MRESEEKEMGKMWTTVKFYKEDQEEEKEAKIIL